MSLHSTYNEKEQQHPANPINRAAARSFPKSGISPKKRASNHQRGRLIRRSDAHVNNFLPRIFTGTRPNSGRSRHLFLAICLAAFLPGTVVLAGVHRSGAGRERSSMGGHRAAQP
jgi:hypothetical protein